MTKLRINEIIEVDNENIHWCSFECPHINCENYKAYCDLFCGVQLNYRDEHPTKFRRCDSCEALAGEIVNKLPKIKLRIEEIITTDNANIHYCSKECPYFDHRKEYEEKYIASCLLFDGMNLDWDNNSTRFHRCNSCKKFAKEIVMGGNL